MSPASGDGPLAGVRVLEWGTRVSAPYAGLLLASLGADVIKLEARDGDPARSGGPFAADVPDPEQSALFHALNLGKRSVLDDDGEELARLLPDADVLLTNVPLDIRQARAGDTATLLARHPRLVAVAVSPFGDSGPLAGAPGTALTSAAYGGASIAIGWPERAPLTLPYELADYEAGVHAAAAAVAGLLARDASGTGQAVDVATADVIASYVLTNAQMYRPYGKPWMREGRRASRSGGAYPYAIFPCRDGSVALIGRTREDWKRLVSMLGDPPWAQDPRFQDPFEIAEQHADAADEHLCAWLAERTRAELVELARDAGVALGPVRSIAETLEEPQFRERGVFSRCIELGGRRFTPARLPWEPDLSPAAWSRAVAPRLGQHAGERWRTGHSRAREQQSVAVPADRPVLDGIRVLDFTWVWSGPMACATLADLGADVIKIEHRGRLDNARMRGRPVIDGVALEGPLEEVSLYFRQNNRGKRSLTVDLKAPEGQELIRRLVAHSDVLVENLARGVFARAGLDLAELQRENPHLIVVSMSAVGETGPLSDLRVYAPVMSGLTGLDSLVGYPDDPELGMVNLAIGDPNAASHTLVALLAALHERRRSGRGRVLDVAQVEALLAPLPEAYAELQVAGRDPRARAAAPAGCAPSGHFPCAGDGRWIALAVGSDAAWATVAGLLGGGLDDASFARHADRVAAAEELERALAARTAERDRDELVRKLLARGVAAAPVHELDEVLASEQLRARGLLEPAEHPHTGAHELVRTPWSMSATPPQVRASAPTVGQHTDEILRDVLGLDAGEIARLHDAGVLD